MSKRIHKDWQHERLVTVIINLPLVEDCCWVWPQGCTTAGYGVMWEPDFGGKGRAWYVHRESLRLWGELPTRAGQVFTLHSCHNPSCFNPQHLSWGTHLDNMKSKRHRTLVEAGLTPYYLDKIKTSTLSERKTAVMYGVTRSLITRIRKGAFDDV